MSSEPGLQSDILNALVVCHVPLPAASHLKRAGGVGSGSNLLFNFVFERKEMTDRQPVKHCLIHARALG